MFGFRKKNEDSAVEDNDVMNDQAVLNSIRQKLQDSGAGMAAKKINPPEEFRKQSNSHLSQEESVDFEDSLEDDDWPDSDVDFDLRDDGVNLDVEHAMKTESPDEDISLEDDEWVHDEDHSSEDISAANDENLEHFDDLDANDEVDNVSIVADEFLAELDRQFDADLDDFSPELNELKEDIKVEHAAQRNVGDVINYRSNNIGNFADSQSNYNNYSAISSDPSEEISAAIKDSVAASVRHSVGSLISMKNNSTVNHDSSLRDSVLAGVVREAVRSHVVSWLNVNLPSLVNDVVQREIKKLIEGV